MPLREIVGKMFGFGLTAAALAGGGILVLIGSHAYNDYFNIILGWGLVGLGVITAGYGAFGILAILYDARVSEEEHEVHITPRGGPPAPPPPWGMGDIGRPGGGADVTRERSGGAPRLNERAVSNTRD
jgi:hypothetical protein